MSFVVKAYIEDLYNLSVFIWTDSEIVLNWLKCVKKVKPYVQQRLDNMRLLVPGARWGHVRSRDNPADLLSRGVTAKIFLKSIIWNNGPEWLSDERAWPPHDIEALEIVVNENNSDTFSETHPKIRLENGHTNLPHLSFPVDAALYSSYQKFLRICGYMLQFVETLKYKVLNINEYPVTDNTISISNDLEFAEIKVIKHVQRVMFPSIVRHFEAGPAGKVPHLVRQLNLTCVDVVLRCVGRLKYSELNYEFNLS